MRIKKGTSMLRRKANEVKRYRQEKKIVPIIMACIAVLTGIVYVVALMYTKFGAFTISVDKYDHLEYGLSLSEHADFSNPTSRLDCQAARQLTNIDGKILEDYPIGATDGVDNRDDQYMCYTFYVRNTGEKAVSYEYSINIVRMTLDIETAVRIRLMTTYPGEETTQVDYAHAAGVNPDGTPIPEMVPYECTNFRSDVQVCCLKKENFQPGETTKYTVVLWLEGNDKECLNNILGGEFKIDLKFTVLN